MPLVVLPLSLCALTACSCLIKLAVSIFLKNALRSWITGSTSVVVLEIDMARYFVEATAARGGIQIPGSSCVPMAWPRSVRALGLLLGRGQVVLWGFCLAEVKSRSVASAWPRSGCDLGLLRGRGHVALSGGFCLAEVMSPSLGSAWPRSGLRPWLLQLLLCRA